MDQDHNKQKQISSNNEAFYNSNKEETKLIENSKDVKSINSLYYASKSSPPCCSKDTKIKVPGGEVCIADINVGDLVISQEGLTVSAIQINKIPVINHKVLSILLNDKTTLEVSPEHPTADGRMFKDLKVGDTLDNRVVELVELIPYNYSHTYDILPDSPSGTYYANGVLIGSTLAKGNYLKSFLKLALRIAS